MLHVSRALAAEIVRNYAAAAKKHTGPRQEEKGRNLTAVLLHHLQDSRAVSTPVVGPGAMLVRVHERSVASPTPWPAAAARPISSTRHLESLAQGLRIGPHAAAPPRRCCAPPAALVRRCWLRLLLLRQQQDEETGA